jgi:Ca-activated chloride channel family protein
VSGLTWKNPVFLYGAGALVVVLAIAYALEATRRRRLLDNPAAAQLARMAASVSTARRRVKTFLLVLGVGLLALAAARPQTEGQKLWRNRGIDVVIALDLSRSMQATDIYPSRVERARIELDRLLDRIGGDRVGLVLFAGDAVGYPLTHDQEVMRMLYRGLQPGDLPPGTDIGRAIASARCLLVPEQANDPACVRLRHPGGAGQGDVARVQRKLETAELGSRGRAVILITDGEDTDGQAKAEVDRAAQLGIETFVVGVGTPEGARVPVYDDDGRRVDWKKDKDGTEHKSTLKEDGLRELARGGGGEGHYYRIDAGLAPLVPALGKLKEGSLEERTESVPVEAYPWVLFPGFMALLVEACLSDRRRSAAKDKVRA